MLEITGTSLFDSQHRLEDSQLYLVYNFGTTIIWCLEVTLTVLVPAEDEGGWLDFSLVWIELLLAIYFLTDSILLFQKWAKTGDWESELADTMLNTIGYVYFLIKPGACERLMWCKWRERTGRVTSQRGA